MVQWIEPNSFSMLYDEIVKWVPRKLYSATNCCGLIVEFCQHVIMTGKASRNHLYPNVLQTMLSSNSSSFKLSMTIPISNFIVASYGDCTVFVGVFWARYKLLPGSLTNTQKFQVGRKLREKITYIELEVFQHIS